MFNCKICIDEKCHRCIPLQVICKMLNNILWQISTRINDISFLTNRNNISQKYRHFKNPDQRWWIQIGLTILFCGNIKRFGWVTLCVCVTVAKRQIDIDFIFLNAVSIRLVHYIQVWIIFRIHFVLCFLKYKIQRIYIYG